MSQTPSISAALAELLARDGELDRIIDGRGPSFERAAVVDATPQLQPQSFVIEPPDWDQEHAELQAREREQREREARELVASLEGDKPPKPTPPAQPAAKRRRWKADT